MLLILCLISHSCPAQKTEKKVERKKILINKYLLNKEIIYSDTIKTNFNSDTTIIKEILPLKVVEISDTYIAMIYSTDNIAFISKNNLTEQVTVTNQKKVLISGSEDTLSYSIDDIFVFDFNNDKENEIVIKWNSWDEDFGLEIFQMKDGIYNSRLWTGIFSFSYEQRDKMKFLKDKIEVITCSNCEEGPRYEGSKFLIKSILFQKGNFLLK